MRRVILFSFSVALSACVASTDEPPTVPSQLNKSIMNLVHRDPIYYGLKQDSYGPMIVYRDVDTQKPTTPPSCNPNAKYSDVNELARNITAIVASPLQRAFPTDDPIVQEEMQHNFKITSDPSGTPPVGILDRDARKIVFWHESDLVTLDETSNAAEEFCKKKHKRSLYVGSSRKCSEPKIMPVIVNGQRTSVETYAISSYSCVVS